MAATLETSQLELAAAVYRFANLTVARAADALTRLRDDAFPNGSVVRSFGLHPQWGIVDTYGVCKPDQIGVLFENGNTWDKSFTDWEIIADRKFWPSDMKGRVMKYKNRKTSAEARLCS